jgi:hypothetical protein
MIALDWPRIWTPINHNDEMCWGLPKPCTRDCLRAAKEGRLGTGAPLRVAASRRSSGKRGLADRKHHVVPHLRRQYVVLLVQPSKLGFEIAYSLLQAAHL